PWRTSWTTGRQVTASSRSKAASSLSRPAFRKASTHTDVSTRSIGSRAGAAARGVPPHLRELALPKARAGQLDDPPRLDPADVVGQCFADHARVRALAAQADGLGEQPFIEHK